MLQSFAGEEVLSKTGRGLLTIQALLHQWSGEEKLLDLRIQATSILVFAMKVIMDHMKTLDVEPMLY